CSRDRSPCKLPPTGILIIHSEFQSGRFSWTLLSDPRTRKPSCFNREKHRGKTEIPSRLSLGYLAEVCRSSYQSTLGSGSFRGVTGTFRGPVLMQENRFLRLAH